MVVPRLKVFQLFVQPSLTRLGVAQNVFVGHQVEQPRECCFVDCDAEFFTRDLRICLHESVPQVVRVGDGKSFF